MEKEISNGTMFGIVLIALAVIIALGFGVFSIAKGTANEGVTKVQTQLTNVQASEFTDYDQTVVTGTQVKSAISNFEGKAVAILIQTAALVNETGGAGNVTDERLIETDEEGDDNIYMNYNALLAVGTDGDLTASNGKYLANEGFDVDAESGNIKFFNAIANINKSGMQEYVNPGSKFNANLVIDPSGTIIGVVFKQISSNIQIDTTPGTTQN